MTFTNIIAQVRAITGADATQWSTDNIVNSINQWLDKVIGYGAGADKTYPIDDTNHTKLPIGQADLVANQDYYSFLTDEQGNKIIGLTRIDIKDDAGIWRQLQPIDQSIISPQALNEFMKSPSNPIFYDKISDNVIKLYPASDTSVSGAIEYHFIRTPSYFTSSDTTKEPGFANELHRGGVINCAYDCAFALGLDNLNALAVERDKEDNKMAEYFMNRQPDVRQVFRGKNRSSK